MGQVNPQIDAATYSGSSDVDTDQGRSSSSSSSTCAQSSNGSMESELVMARVCDGGVNSVTYSQSSLSSVGSISLYSLASEADSILSSQMSLASQASMQSQSSLASQASMQTQASIQSQASLASQASSQSQASLASQASLQSDLSQSSSLGFLPSLQLPPGSGRMSWQQPQQQVEHRCVATVRGEPGGGHVSSLAVEGGYLYAGWSSKEIRVWTLTNGVAADLALACGRFGSGDGAVKAIVTAGDRLFSAHQDHRIRVWRKASSGPSVVDHKLVATVPTVKDYLKTFLPPPNYVLVRRHHRRLWIEHVDTISCLAADPGRSLLYSASWDRTVKVWRMRDFKCVESIRAHDDAVNALAVAPAGGHVYTGAADGKVKVWARPEGGAGGHSLVATLEAHKSAVNALALSPDGNILYSGACDRAIVVWEREGSAQHMAAAGALRGHRGSVLCLTAHADLLCSGSADRTIRIWLRLPASARPGPALGHACIAALRGHSAPVKCLHLSLHPPSHRYVIYSGSLDRDIKIWRLDRPQSDADHD